MSRRARRATLATSAAEMGVPDGLTASQPTSLGYGTAKTKPRRSGERAEIQPDASEGSSEHPL
jgi:hypothetical protein